MQTVIPVIDNSAEAVYASKLAAWLVDVLTAILAVL